MFCFNCGVKVVDPSSKFCTSCGVKLRAIESASPNSADKEVELEKDFSSQVKDAFSKTTRAINGMVGEEGSIDMNLKDVFSDVFKKHTQEEGEALFISGTKQTTPKENEITTSWPKPWLFSRVFLVLAATYILLYICVYTFQNSNAIPGLMMIGSFLVPFSLLIFFWETNAPRNISIYEVVKMLFIGGTSSLVITLLLYSFLPVFELGYLAAITVGIVEEVGKLMIIAYFVNRLNTSFILNGLLIGAAIGAGFAAFESAGYAFNFGLLYGNEAMISIIFNRAWMSIGTHVIWSAIAGAALVYVKGNSTLQKNHFLDNKFIRLFSVAIILHAIWDMPLYILQQYHFIYLVLIIVAWIFTFTLINAGLKQIIRLTVDHDPEMNPIMLKMGGKGTTMDQ
ncbi:PrsW family glutamic-type intramembrane protease [Radiobacillus sp. PE A8.2]|uniref:PrsW family intramembrane metalloprotease n=1 Tax=Radiobacillus sp. PE A8.2 TaxID=3380349 RepID=UPI00388D5792